MQNPDPTAFANSATPDLPADPAQIYRRDAKRSLWSNKLEEMLPTSGYWISNGEGVLTLLFGGDEESRLENMKLPDDFSSYLRSDAPKFGDRDDFPVGFELWNEADLETFNINYEVPKYAPEFFGFGSDGGGEMLAFGPDGKIYVLPFIGMEPKVATLVADSWTDFQSTFK